MDERVEEEEVGGLEELRVEAKGLENEGVEVMVAYNLPFSVDSEVKHVIAYLPT